MNQQTLEGEWNQIKGKIRDRWGEFSNDDFARARGSVEELIGVIQQKTGEAREQVEDYLNSISPDNDFVNNAKEMAVEYAAYARENVGATAQHAMDQAKAGYIQTERIVRNKPIESLAVCFGVGLVAGVVGGILMRSK